MLLNDRDQIIAMTAEWAGERYPNGRPRVSDENLAAAVLLRIPVPVPG